MIRYKKRRKYKYNLHSDFTYSTGIVVDAPRDLGYVGIDSEGELSIKAGYSWEQTAPAAPRSTQRTSCADRSSMMPSISS